MKCEGEGEEEDAGGDPEDALRPAVAPCGCDSKQGSGEEGEGEVVVGAEEEREGDGNEEGSGGSSCGDEEVEEGGLGGALRTESIGFAMAEEAGDEALDEEEGEGEDDGECEVGLGESVAETGEHYDEDANDESAAIEGGAVEREDEGEEIGGEGKDPEQGNGGDVRGDVGGDGGRVAWRRPSGGGTRASGGDAEQAGLHLGAGWWGFRLVIAG